MGYALVITLQYDARSSALCHFNWLLGAKNKASMVGSGQSITSRGPSHFAQSHVRAVSLPFPASFHAFSPSLGRCRYCRLRPAVRNELFHPLRQSFCGGPRQLRQSEYHHLAKPYGEPNVQHVEDRLQGHPVGCRRVVPNRRLFLHTYMHISHQRSIRLSASTDILFTLDLLAHLAPL